MKLIKTESGILREKRGYINCFKTEIKMKTKVFIAEIEITENCYHWKIGDTVNVPILAQSEYFANKMVDDNFWGSEFPNYRVMRVIEYRGDFLFNMQIQKASVKDIVNYNK